MATEQDHVWAMLDDMLVFLAKRHVPTPERTYKLDGGWTLAMDDLRRFVDSLTADRESSDRHAMAADEELNRAKQDISEAEKQRDRAQAIAARADAEFGNAIRDWKAALATIDMLRGSNDTLAAEVERVTRQLAEERARLEKLYELADVSADGKIVISLPLAKDSAWDGVTAWWSEGHFTAAVDAARKQGA